jgi:hypothetical protein
MTLLTTVYIIMRMNLGGLTQYLYQTDEDKYGWTTEITEAVLIKTFELAQLKKSHFAGSSASIGIFSLDLEELSE